nr:MAG TPA: hypothetical protein [Caudoviricetes sp.]
MPPIQSTYTSHQHRSDPTSQKQCKYQKNNKKIHENE